MSNQLTVVTIAAQFQILTDSEDPDATAKAILERALSVVPGLVVTYDPLTISSPFDGHGVAVVEPAESDEEEIELDDSEAHPLTLARPQPIAADEEEVEEAPARISRRGRPKRK